MKNVPAIVLFMSDGVNKTLVLFLPHLVWGCTNSQQNCVAVLNLANDLKTSCGRNNQHKNQITRWIKYRSWFPKQEVKYLAAWSYPLSAYLLVCLHRTRAVCVEFSLYNINTNLLAVFSFLFEFPISERAQSSFDLLVISLWPITGLDLQLLLMVTPGNPADSYQFFPPS